MHKVFNLILITSAHKKSFLRKNTSKVQNQPNPLISISKERHKTSKAYEEKATN